MDLPVPGKAVVVGWGVFGFFMVFLFRKSQKKEHFLKIMGVACQVFSLGV